MRRRQSRLNRRIERRSKRNLILSLLGIIAVIFLILKVGIPLLVNFSLFIANQKDKTASSQNASPSDASFISPPVLDSLPTATNSAQITLSGTGNPNQTVRIYVNDDLKDEVPTKKDGTFSLVQDIAKGLNIIKAKSESKGKESDFSQSVTVTYIDTKPTLDLTSPSDGQTFSKAQNTAPVSGKTSSGSKITVNGFWAIVDENNNFSYIFPLQNGDNQIKVVATDDAGNIIEKDIKVTYSP